VKSLKIAAGWLLGTFILLQFVRIDMPPPPKAEPGEEIEAPSEIAAILERSCYDCHSNHTRWPWYSHISPISLEIKSHVKNGRNWLNFSIWKSYDEEKRRKLYEGIARSVEWKMPPADYMLLHKAARLSPKERRALKEWAMSHLEEEKR
jgi:hypothetical protein